MRLLTHRIYRTCFIVNARYLHQTKRIQGCTSPVRIDVLSHEEVPNLKGKFYLKTTN